MENKLYWVCHYRFQPNYCLLCPITSVFLHELCQCQSIPANLFLTLFNWTQRIHNTFVDKLLVIFPGYSCCASLWVIPLNNCRCFTWSCPPLQLFDVFHVCWQRRNGSGTCSSCLWSSRTSKPQRDYSRHQQVSRTCIIEMHIHFGWIKKAMTILGGSLAQNCSESVVVLIQNNQMVQLESRLLCWPVKRHVPETWIRDMLTNTWVSQPQKITVVSRTQMNSIHE